MVVMVHSAIVQPKSPVLSVDLFKALLALGSPVEHCDAAMKAMRSGARGNTYHNPMALSQILPALHQRSYLSVKNKNCQNEEGMYSAMALLCGHFRRYQVISLFLFLFFFTLIC